MTFIRSLLFWCFFALSIIAFALGIGLLALVVRDSARLDRLASRWGQLNIGAMRILCGLDVDIRGEEGLPKGGGFILASKHQSTWETIFLRGYLPGHQVWVLKQELLAIPFFGYALRKTGQIAIDRKAGKQALRQLVEAGNQALSQGKTLVIFPEGTRTPFGEANPTYHAGAAMLADKTGASIYPVAHNAGFFWPRRSFLIRPGRVQLSIGPAIVPEGLKTSAINERLKSWIEAEMQRL
jgi:1-acyl-sn-glycerol-3-phosphate acyltransferase